MLRRRLGGKSVLRGQLEQILLIGHKRNVEIQVMPLDREDNAGVDGPFTVITRKGGDQFVYTEVQGRSNLLTDRDEARLASARYGIIRSQALSSARDLGIRREVAGRAMNTEATRPAESELAWFKSSYSGAEGGDCVEVAAPPGAVLIRDSKQLAGPVLAVGAEAWAGFVSLASGR